MSRVPRGLTSFSKVFKHKLCFNTHIPEKIVAYEKSQSFASSLMRKTKWRASSLTLLVLESLWRDFAIERLTVDYVCVVFNVMLPERVRVHEAT